jgi:hypothetical protein
MQCQPRSSNRSVAQSPTVSVIVTDRSSFLSIANTVVQGFWAVLFLWLLLVASSGIARAQQATKEPAPAPQATEQQPTALPFEVSNPKHQKWPEAEASRIYTWACDLLARSIRPERPPRLHPAFRLVLGSGEDAFVRDQGIPELHLKSWNSEKFAQGVVVVALRDLVPRSDLARLARQSVSLAGATLDAREIQH